MELTDLESYFAEKGVKPTANRILVLRTLAAADTPVSLSDLEMQLPTMDKSSIFRVLSLFLEHDIVHSFEDGRGILNYELCASHGECSHTDSHIHFYCESCRRSFCLDNVFIPGFTLPDGFTPHSVSFVIKGECAQCRHANHFK